jgi:hypothetical protein
MKVADKVAKILKENPDLHGVSFPVIDAVVREAVEALALCVPPDMLASEVGEADVAPCAGARCGRLIDLVHPEVGASKAGEDWYCGVCWAQDMAYRQRAGT